MNNPNLSEILKLLVQKIKNQYLAFLLAIVVLFVIIILWFKNIPTLSLLLVFFLLLFCAAAGCLIFYFDDSKYLKSKEDSLKKELRIKSLLYNHLLQQIETEGYTELRNKHQSYVENVNFIKDNLLNTDN